MGEGSRSGVKVYGGVKVRGQDHGFNVRVMIGGHKVGGQGQGNGQGQGRGSRSGGLGSDGRWGRLEINSLFLSRTHDRIEFHSVPIHSIPFTSIPFHLLPFQSIPLHVLPNAVTFNLLMVLEKHTFFEN